MLVTKGTTTSATGNKPVPGAVPGGVPAYSLGDQVLVNADYVTGPQRQPTIAVLSDGSYIIAWDDDSGRDGSIHGVFAQRLNASGARVGEEFRVNTHTNSAQTQPAATGLAGGGYVIVWSSYGQDTSLFGVYGQRYGADGQPLEDEFQINTHTSGYQLDPSVSALADGGFVVAWTDRSGKDGSDYGVFAQKFTKNGIKDGKEFQANTHTVDRQYDPAISGLEGGGFVIVWSSDNNQDGDSYGIFGQRYKANGSKDGAEFQINTYTPSSQHNPTVTGLVGGGFVVLWQSSGQDGAGEGVYGQVFAKNGQAVRSEFRVNGYTSGNQMRPAVTALADGGFTVTWDSAGSDASGTGIFGQRFAANGAEVGEEFRISKTAAGTQFQPAIAALGNGDVAVAWSAFTSAGGYDINTRVLDGPATGPTGGTAGNKPTRRVGAGGDDMLTGDNDQDILVGKAGNDTLDGGGGSDRLRGGDGSDSLSGGAGDDALLGDQGDDSLAGGADRDRLLGGTGNDTLSGGSGRDILLGDRGDDSLSGGADRDILRGGAGNDTLSGGSSRDRYVFARGDGADSIDNADAAQTLDILAFDAGIGHDQLWFARSGQDLVVSVIGTADSVTVEDWYAGADNRHLTIRTDDRQASLAERQVQGLVNAMAGVSPPALGTLDLSSSTHSSVETAIAASWQLGA